MGGTLTDRQMTELLNKPALKLVYEVMLKIRMQTYIQIHYTKRF